MHSSLNAPDLSSLLGANAPAPSYLYGGPQTPPGFGGSAFADAFPAGSSSSILASIILKQQAEDQQRALFAQKIAMLGGLQGSNAPAPVDSLAFLIQQRQLQALNERVAGPAAGLGVLSGMSAPEASGSFYGGGMPGMQTSNQLDSLSLAKLLQQARNQTSAPTQPTQAAPDSRANASSLPLPPDRRRKGRTGTFPQKLHQMLSDLERQEGGSDIASFLPHGRTFAIHKPREFVKQVMPKYFRMSRFSSFQRQLNLYDFQRITEGPDKGAYYHELFVQGRPILSTMMKRNKIKGVKSLQQQNGKKDEDPSVEGANEEGDDEEEETASS